MTREHIKAAIFGTIVGTAIGYAAITAFRIPLRHYAAHTAVSRAALGRPLATYKLVRHIDRTGISGTGHVANVRDYGNLAVVEWIASRSYTIWPALSDVVRVHGHNGDTTLERVE